MSRNFQSFTNKQTRIRPLKTKANNQLGLIWKRKTKSRDKLCHEKHGFPEDLDQCFQMGKLQKLCQNPQFSTRLVPDHDPYLFSEEEREDVLPVACRPARDKSALRTVQPVITPNRTDATTVRNGSENRPGFTDNSSISNTLPSVKVSSVHSKNLTNGNVLCTDSNISVTTKDSAHTRSERVRNKEKHVRFNLKDVVGIPEYGDSKLVKLKAESLPEKLVSIREASYEECNAETNILRSSRMSVAEKTKAGENLKSARFDEIKAEEPILASERHNSEVTVIDKSSSEENNESFMLKRVEISPVSQNARISDHCGGRALADQVHTDCQTTRSNTSGALHAENNNPLSRGQTQSSSVVRNVGGSLVDQVHSDYQTAVALCQKEGFQLGQDCDQMDSCSEPMFPLTQQIKASDPLSIRKCDGEPGNSCLTASWSDCDEQNLEVALVYAEAMQLMQNKRKSFFLKEP